MSFNSAFVCRHFDLRPSLSMERLSFQRKAMRKNAQTTTQLHSSHTLVK